MANGRGQTTRDERTCFYIHFRVERPSVARYIRDHTKLRLLYARVFSNNFVHFVNNHRRRVGTPLDQPIDASLNVYRYLTTVIYPFLGTIVRTVLLLTQSNLRDVQP